MKPTESVKILALAVAAYPGMSIPEGTPEVWHELLSDLDFPDCRAAVLQHARLNSTIVTPADIRRLVAAARSDRASRSLAIDGRLVRQTDPPPEWHEARKQLAARARRPQDSPFAVAMEQLAEALDGSAKP